MPKGLFIFLFPWDKLLIVALPGQVTCTFVKTLARDCQIAIPMQGCLLQPILASIEYERFLNSLLI